MILKIAIVEDDYKEYETLFNMLERFKKEYSREINVKYFDNGLKFLSDYSPIYDIVFMDINMPQINGLDTARQLRKLDPYVLLVFVTDLAQFAIKGYEVDAFDYIVKPLVYDHLALKMKKATSLLKYRINEKKISVKVDDGIIALSPSDIEYVEIDSHKIIYHTTTGLYNAYGSLSDVENNLPETFARCNHCYLVNLKFVTLINGYDIFIGENKLQISRPRKKGFIETFNKYLGRIS